MPFKPEVSKGNGFLGIRPISFISAEEDKEKNFEIFLKLNILMKGSQYESESTLLGNFKRGSDGTIEKCPLLNKINKLFEALGDSGGVDVNGNWVTADDKPISDIAEYLTSKYAGGTDIQPYVAYFYKQRAKDGKVYNRTYCPFYPNTDEGKKDLESLIAFIKGKGYLVEYEETPEKTESPGSYQPYNGQF